MTMEEQLLEVRHKTLDLIRVGCQARISQSVISTLRFELSYLISKELLARLEVFIPGQRSPQVSTETANHYEPRNALEMLKRDLYRAFGTQLPRVIRWLVRRWPVKTRLVKLIVTWRPVKVYPQLECGPLKGRQCVVISEVVSKRVEVLP